jgi:hypothetical protein
VSALRTVAVTRYVTPLREGGSVPAIVEADDDGMYVLKFRGAGQGPKALIAELLAGEIGRAADLPVPEIVLIQLDPDLARTEPDPEIQDLIRASGGLNVALDYLPGAVTFDPVTHKPAAALASAIVWFDAFVTNVDRTARNTNMLMWHRQLHLIDHGAALYFHHAWADDYLERSRDPFPRIRDHVLLPFAGALAEAHESMLERLTPQVIRSLVALPAAGRRFVGRSGIRHCRRISRRVRALLAAPARAAARFLDGGPACPRPARMTTRSCASCRASSAKSSSMRV